MTKESGQEISIALFSRMCNEQDLLHLGIDTVDCAEP